MWELVGRIRRAIGLEKVEEAPRVNHPLLRPTPPTLPSQDPYTWDPHQLVRANPDPWLRSLFGHGDSIHFSDRYPKLPVEGEEYQNPRAMGGTLPDGTVWMVSRAGETLNPATVTAEGGGVTVSVRTVGGFIRAVSIENASITITTPGGVFVVDGDGARRA